jgi:Tfp pilus assembly protein PilE
MKVSKSAIFLFELMVVILVFTIAAAICTSIFVKAYKFSADSEDLTTAVIKAESAAEKFKASGKDGRQPDELYFDKDWESVASETDAAFKIVLSPSAQGNMSVCDIEVYRNNDSIYSLEVKSYG